METPRRRRARVLGAVVLGLATVAAPPSLAQPGADGIDWVTVGAPGNPAYHGPDPEGLVTGRGSVAYEYRIGRFEVTTSNWIEFVNAFSARVDPAPIDIIRPATFWGAAIDPTYTGPGRRYYAPTPQAGMRPVTGIDWRTAARYCNWLHNNKGTSYSDLADGAYDTSTFSFDSQGRFTDQLTHHASARYWIPTLDEWMKAAHYDPSNPTRDGWWLYPHRSDTAPIYGPPVGFAGGSPINQANAGFAIGQAGHWLIPLGSYPDVMSPWGLLDVSGGAREWTEGIIDFPGPGNRYRIHDGAGAGAGTESDLVYLYGGDRPATGASDQGLRIASVVPSAGTVVLIVFGTIAMRNRRARRQENSR